MGKIIVFVIAGSASHMESELNSALSSKPWRLVSVTHDKELVATGKYKSFWTFFVEVEGE